MPQPLRSSWLPLIVVGAVTSLPAQTFLATTANSGLGCQGLTLVASTAPVLGTTVSYPLGGAPATTAFAGIVLGFAALPNAVALDGLGMPGCFQYLDLSAAAVGLMIGSPLPAYQLAIPVVPSLNGLPLVLQGIAFDSSYPGGAATSDLVSASIGFAANTVPPTALNMQAIGPGVFLMGQNSISTPSHQEHQVTLTYPFWIGKYEVTQSEWVARMGSNPSYFQLGGWQQRPVEWISWHAARSYCQSLTMFEQAAGRVPPGYEYRLPTEAEWEYCCRAGTTSEWNAGASLNTNQANFSNTLGGTIAVGSYGANLWGLFDTHGNVWEWCLDSFADYAAGPLSDPFVTGGSNREVRGGSWYYDAPICRSAYRNGSLPTYTYTDVGFRVVLGPILVP